MWPRGRVQKTNCERNVFYIIVIILLRMFQLYSLRGLMQGSKKNQGIAPLGNNFRPPQPLHNRLVRTNIDFNLRKVIYILLCRRIRRKIGDIRIIVAYAIKKIYKGGL